MNGNTNMHNITRLYVTNSSLKVKQLFKTRYKCQGLIQKHPTKCLQMEGLFIGPSPFNIQSLSHIAASHGRQRICWMDNIKEWTSMPMPKLLTTASCGKDWKGISAEMSPKQPNQSRTWPERHVGSMRKMHTLSSKMASFAALSTSLII